MENKKNFSVHCIPSHNTKFTMVQTIPSVSGVILFHSTFKHVVRCGTVQGDCCHNFVPFVSLSLVLHTFFIGTGQDCRQDSSEPVTRDGLVIVQLERAKNGLIQVF